MIPSSDPLVCFAQEVIRTWVAEKQQLTWNAYIQQTDMPIRSDTELLMNGASSGVFVSLHRNDQLRGCIGTIEPMRDALAVEIASNAVAACSADPRFPPVQEYELSGLEVNVDKLEPPVPYAGPIDWDVRRYGVVVSGLGGRRGLLLPDLDGVDTAPEQLSIAAQKAGLDTKSIQSVMLFEVQRHR